MVCGLEEAGREQGRSGGVGRKIVRVRLTMVAQTLLRQLERRAEAVGHSLLQRVALPGEGEARQ